MLGERSVGVWRRAPSSGNATSAFGRMGDSVHEARRINSCLLTRIVASIDRRFPTGTLSLQFSGKQYTIGFVPAGEKPDHDWARSLVTRARSTPPLINVFLMSRYSG